MGQKVFAIQLFFIGVIGALLSRDYLSTNFIVSVLIGFFGGGAVFGLAMALAPRVMFFGLVALYALGGFSTAQNFEWGVIETIVLTLFAGGLGWAANVSIAQDAYFSRTDANTTSMSDTVSNTKELLEHEEKSELFFDAARCYRKGLIGAKAYERICVVIEEQASGRKRAGQPTPVSEMAQKPNSEFNSDDQMAIVNLRELGLVSDREWAEAQQLLDTAIEAESI